MGQGERPFEREEQLKSLAGVFHGTIRPLRAARAVGNNPANPWYEVELASVSRDLLPQNLLKIGHRIEKMKRVKLASLEVDTVPEGQYWRLAPDEVTKARARSGPRAQESKAGNDCPQKSARTTGKTEVDAFQSGNFREVMDGWAGRRIDH